MVARQLRSCVWGAIMRVTVEHREEAAGLGGQKRNYFVDCAIEFSEEEKAIIKARRLYDQIVTSGYFSPPPSRLSQNAAPWLRAVVAPVAAMIGLIVGIQSAFTHVGEGASFLLLLAAGGLWAYGFFEERKQDALSEKVTITIRNIIDRKRFSIYASSPAQAKAIDEDLREKLVALKSFIAGSAEIAPKQTFEL
jgi:hypothetical protein